MTKPIDNSMDIIDSRDVIARIENLQSIECGGAESRELAMLVLLQDQCESYVPDWQYGVALIRHSYFKTYAQELADDCGLLKSNNAWPYTCLDWEQAARELAMDYTEVDFDNVSYLVR